MESNFWFGFFVPMTIYIFVMMVTPGPNNTMLMASGLNFGGRRTFPHALGIMCGYPILFSFVGLGLGELFARYPLMNHILKYGGAAYLLWLAWRIATNDASLDKDDSLRSSPLTFVEAVAIQVLNVKGWVAAVAGNAAYIAGNDWVVRLITANAVIFIAIGISSLIWTVLGVGMKKILKGKAMRIVNIALALLLISSIIPVIL